jgi:hypothetical protein
MPKEKTKVNLSFESEMSESEIAFVAAALGGLRWVKSKFEKEPVQPENSNKKKKKLSSEDE